MSKPLPELSKKRVWFLKGNHSFLQFKDPIKIVGSDGSCEAEDVLEHLINFEKRNPNLQVADWKTETVTLNPEGEPALFCLGLWIDHEPREEGSVPIRRMLNDDLLEVEEPISELANALGQD